MRKPASDYWKARREREQRTEMLRRIIRDRQTQAFIERMRKEGKTRGE